MTAAAPLKVRFDLPRSEIARAASDWTERGRAASGGGRFELQHLLGRLHIDIGVPLAPDPILKFLQEKRGLRVEPPFTVSFDEPLGHALAGLTGFSVLALFGEGSFMVPLRGTRGALGVDLDGGSLQLSVPLDRYAGVAPLPPRAACESIAKAAESLAALVVGGQPSLAEWPLITALRRDAAILRGIAAAELSPVQPSAVEPSVEDFSVDGVALGTGPSLVERLVEAERAGARVVPYWKVEAFQGSKTVRFEPLRPPGLPQARGTLARLLFPDGARSLRASWSGDTHDAARLAERLRRHAPFSASASEDGRRLDLSEQPGPLPMA